MSVKDSSQVTDVSKQLLALINNCSGSAPSVFGLTGTPAEKIEQIDKLLVECQENVDAFVAKFPGEDIVALFGVAWGQCLVEEFGWQWKSVSFVGDGADEKVIAVVSPDRSLAIYPFDYVRAYVEDPTVDVTIALAFNILQAKNHPSFEPDELVDFMSGVQRIVPR